MTTNLNLATLFKESKNIAVVGLSPDPGRTSHRIAGYMQDAGFRVIPVNPNASEVLGEAAYPDLASIPEEIQIDIVNIFRRPRYTEGVVQEIVERIKRTGENPVIWTQIGVDSQAARQLAEASSLAYVQNRCIMVEHSRLTG